MQISRKSNIINKEIYGNRRLIVPDKEKERRAKEIWKCRTNPLYFIHNYCYLDEGGGQQIYSKELMHNKIRRVVRSIYRYKKCILMASRQLGKALDIETLIPTIDGNYIILGDIKIGDIILDGSGYPTKVIATTDIMYDRPCYQMNFDTGESINADENHLWKIYTEDNKFERLLKTKDLFEGQENNIFKIKAHYNGINDICIEKIIKISSRPTRCIQVKNIDGMFLCGRTKIPTHNSTIASCLISWAMVFFPRNKAVILNMKQNAGKKNLSMVKFIIKNLPVWMVTDKPFKNRSDTVTFIELFNDSRIEVFYPSTSHDPSTLARSLTVGILYIDESAFIRYMEEIYGSAQQTLSKAREQAQKYGYPYFMLVTSTPNGTQGEGEWFYNRWSNAVESDDIFNLDPATGYETWNDNIDVDEMVKDPSKNTFIRVRYHWSEDPNKSEEWYQEQCQELSDQRKINQELDLLFVGTSQCIFDDCTLSAFTPLKPVITLSCPYYSKLEIYTNKLDPTDWYIIGCDTAQSLTGNWCALQIFGFRNFNQIAELSCKFGSYYNYGEAIHFIFQWLYSQVGERIILSIENNTIGQAPIEYLTRVVKDFNYLPYLDRDVDKSGSLKDELGLKTTGLTKPLMIGCLIETINENIQGFRSRNLINQFGSIEKTAAGTIRSNSSTDLFMAACFCAYTRKRRAMEIMPHIQFTNVQLQNQLFNTVKSAASVASTKDYINFKNKADVGQIIGADDDYSHQFKEDGEIFDSSFLPFFNT